MVAGRLHFLIESVGPGGLCAGVILHPTSLPGPYGIGEIGDEAFRFVDWLVEAGMQAWQACSPSSTSPRNMSNVAC